LPGRIERSSMLKRGTVLYASVYKSNVFLTIRSHIASHKHLTIFVFRILKFLHAALLSRSVFGLTFPTHPFPNRELCRLRPRRTMLGATSLGEHRGACRQHYSNLAYQSGLHHANLEPVSVPERNEESTCLLSFPQGLRLHGIMCLTIRGRQQSNLAMLLRDRLLVPVGPI
jgi:hypothetical protein